MIKAKDLMTRDVKYIQEDAAIKETIIRMKKEGTSSFIASPDGLTGVGHKERGPSYEDGEYQKGTRIRRQADSGNHQQHGYYRGLNKIAAQYKYPAFDPAVNNT